jgi:hypothetical protein
MLDLRNKQFTHLNSYQWQANLSEAREELNTLQAWFSLLAGATRIPCKHHVYQPAIPEQYVLADQRPLEACNPGGDCRVFAVTWAFALID